MENLSQKISRPYPQENDSKDHYPRVQKPTRNNQQRAQDIGWKHDNQKNGDTNHSNATIFSGHSCSSNCAILTKQQYNGINTNDSTIL